MDRRNFFSTISGTKNAESFPENPPSSKGLAPYTDEWGYWEASHLLRRTIFGPSLAQMNAVASMGLEDAITTLLSDIPLPGPPLNAFDQGDSYVAIGETWIGKSMTEANKTYHTNARRKSLKAWNRITLSQGGINVREKMTLFWQNHYATNLTRVPEATYHYVMLLRKHATGNFRQLTKDITVDAMMLRFLNGNENIDEEPNENFARELLELYTIGKGPLVGSGDYTNYTEEDVVQCAKILTGWKVRNQNSTDPAKLLTVNFIANKHTAGSKTLSPRFNNTTIQENGADEYKDLVDVIFNQAAVAKFIVTKIYRYFVYYDVTASVMQNIINPLAQILIDNDYEMKPVLETLFKSEHFFDIPTRGCLIKNPIDYLESAYMQLGWPAPTDLVTNYKFSKQFYAYQYSLGMEFFNAPSVAGWKAYYQSPAFHRYWMNPSTYQKRNLLKNIFISGIKIDGVKQKIDEIALVQTVSDPSSPDAIVTELAKLFLPRPSSNSLLLFLKKNVLIPGLPDAEWTMEYQNYLANPNDVNIKKSVAKKINNLIKALFELPEFQLS